MRRCIFASGSADYLWPAAVTVRRMVRSMQGAVEGRLYLAGNGEIDPALEAFCGSEIRILPLDMSDFHFDRHFRERLNSTTFARLFALRSLVETHDRILYVDCDTLYLGGSLDRLFDDGTEGNPLAAVRDGEFWSGTANRRLRLYLRGLGVPAHRYFNSGVLLVDSAEARSANLVETSFRVLRDRQEICNFHDQSALNYACDGRWKDLSPRWNWQMGQAMLAATWEQMAPHIVHFTGRTKPWADALRKIPSVLMDPYLQVPEIAAMWMSMRNVDRTLPIDQRALHRYAQSERAIRPDLKAWLDESAPYLERLVWGDERH